MIKPEPIRVLYMEDEAGLARLVQRRLELTGYVVDIARDGDEGLAMYDAAIHDVIVVDYKMPIYNGLEVLRLLAARGPLPPAIMLTGSGDEKTAAMAMKLGAGDYIVKDIKQRYLELLPVVVKQVLHKQGLVEKKQWVEAGQEYLLTSEREQRMLAETLRWAGAVVLSDTLNYDEVLDHILEQVGRVTPHDAACILLVDGDTARVSRWHGYTQFGAEASIVSAALKISDMPDLDTVWETGLPVAVSYVEANDPWSHRFGQNWIKSYTTIPISVVPPSSSGEAKQKELFIGFLHVDSATPGFFSQVGAERLLAFANQAAIALKNARLNDQARREIAERARALKWERNFVSAILDTANALIMILNKQGRIIRFNRACERTSGYSSDEVRGKYFWDFLIPEEAELARANFERLCRGELSGEEYESCWVTKEGEQRLIAWSDTVLLNNAGVVEYIVSTGLDITERKRMEKALRESEERYALAALSANDGLWDWNLKTNQVYFSPRWKAMLGYSEDEIGSHPVEWFSRVHPGDLEQLKADIIAHLEGQPIPFKNEHRILHRNGVYRWVLSQGMAVRGADWQAYRMAGSQTDITQRKMAEKELMYNALHDALTGLPNRILFRQTLERSIERAKEDKNYLFAVLFLDLDRFKVINDSLGHMVGDQLLIVIAHRIEAHLRPRDMVARLGGDEFAILLDGIRDAGEATRIATYIQNELSRSVDLQDHTVFVTASIGIALSTVGYDWPEEVLRDADTTMYRAKAGGRARHEVFDIGMRTHAVAVWQLEAELRQAVERQAFQLYYQPILSLTTGQITGVEALVRWQHPQRGMILPDEFIPLAEETGLIVPIGIWALQTACTQTKAWHVAGYPSLRVAVNVSPYQFRQRPPLNDSLEKGSALPEVVGKTLRETDLVPQTLELEITESMVTIDNEFSLAVLNDLSTLGVKIAVDDFGIGSSLGFLKHYPINTLKIDQSFVRDMAEETDDATFITAIIAMAHSLKLKVIAEGVETEDQLAFLRAQQCDEMQGYLFSQPLPANTMTKLLQTGRRLSFEPDGE